MADEQNLIKTITVKDVHYQVDYEALANKPEIPAAYDDTEVKAEVAANKAGVANNLAILRAVLKGNDKEDELAELLYADYPHIELELGEHITFVSILKGKPVNKEGKTVYIPEVMTTENKKTIAYNKDGNGYDTGDDAQFNAFVTVDDGYEILDTGLAGDDTTAYKNLKVNAGGDYVVGEDGNILINATKVVGNFKLTVTATEVPVTEETSEEESSDETETA